jgi:ElaA protein
VTGRAEDDRPVTEVPLPREARFAELTPAELYGLLRLRVDVFVVEQDCPYPELDGRDAEPGTVHLWYADTDGRVLSTIRVLENGADRAIGRVATAADARGRGLSAHLVRRGIELCAGRTVDIGAQAYLEGWYERFGFHRSGPDYLEDGILHLPMRLDGSVAPGQ